MTTHDRRQDRESCGRHGAALVELAASAPLRGRDDGVAADDAATRHLENCRACRDDVESMALVSFAVRRAWDDGADVVPPEIAWPRLRARVTQREPGLGRLGSSLVGLALGAALAVGLVAPLGLQSRVATERGVVLSETGFHVVPLAAARTPEDGLERRWLRKLSSERPLAGPTVDVAQEPAGDGGAPLVLRREQTRYAEEPTRPEDARSAVPAVSFR
jgi:hypothetical protein